MANIDETSNEDHVNACRVAAEVFTQKLEEFIKAVVADHDSVHIEDAVTLSEQRREFVEMIFKTLV